MTARASDDVARLIDAGRDREAAVLGAGRTKAMDALTQLQQLGPALGAVVGGIRPDQIESPTPCEGLTVRGVLEHMLGGATVFAAAYRGQVAGDPPTADPLAAFGPTLNDLGAAMSAPGALDRTIATPFGDMGGEAFARYVVLDGLVHGWDLSTATGQPYEPPADLVAAADATAHTMVDGMRGPAFAAAVEAPPGATALERLVAYTGRKVRANGAA